MGHDPAPKPLADDGSSNLLLEVGRTIRDEFHILAGLSLLFMVAALPWIVLATVTSWAIAWAPLVLVAAPVWALIVACADRFLRGETAPWRRMARDLAQLALPAIRIGMVPALCGSALLALAQGSRDEPVREMLVVTAAGIAAAVLVLLIPAIPLAVRTGASGVSLWQASAFIVVRRPSQVLGSVTIAGIGIWLTVAFGPAILLGVAPLGVLVAAITMPDSD